MNKELGTVTMVQTMNQIVCSHGLTEALTLARPVYGNPLIVSTLAKTIVAITEEPELSDTRWLDLRQNQRVPLSCLYHHEIQDAYAESQSTGKPVLDSMAEDGLPMMRKALVVEGKLVGYLESPLYYGMPSLEQVEFFDLLGNYLAGRLKEELEQPDAPDNMLDYFVYDMLEGKVTNPEVIQERLNFFQWDLLGKGFVQMINIRWLDREDQDGARFRQLAEQLSQRFRGSRVFVYGFEMKMLCPVGQSLELDKSFLERMEELLTGLPVSAGVSRPLDQLACLADFHLQARKASQIGYLVEPEVRLHFFDNMSIYFALELACRSINLDQFIHHSLMVLWEYDKVHDSNLVESLEVYLSHNQSIGEAAAALFIHRNTMNYRVAKIVELTGLDLKNPRVVEHLLFSFCVLRFKNHGESDPDGRWIKSGEKSDEIG